MPSALHTFRVFIDVVRGVLVYAALVAAAICAIDWAVRTRRIGAFSPIARFVRKWIDPLMVPVERRIVRAGGLPTSAPWWTLAAVVVGGLLLVAVLDYVYGLLLQTSLAQRGGPRGIALLLVGWAFDIMQLALLIRVLSSWVRISPYSRWIRWTFTLTEPLLRPLRQVIPPLGCVDITPIIAFFALRLLQGLLANAIA